MSSHLNWLIAFLLPTIGCMVHAALNGDRLAIQGGVLFYAIAAFLITCIAVLGLITVIVLVIVGAAVAWLAIRLSGGGVRRERPIA